MKAIIHVSILAIACLTIADSALAADAEAGKKVFATNCSGCHNNGLNVIVPEKTLKKSALEKNGMFSEKAIINQVTNGKSPMPAFGNMLKPTDIENVAAYVIQRANADWK